MSDRPLIATPESYKARAAELHTELVRQSREANRLAPALRLEWRALRDEWVKWYSAGPNWMWGATGATLDSFATRIGAWAVEIERAGGSAAIVRPSATEPAGSDLAKVAMWVVLGFVAIKLLDG